MNLSTHLVLQNPVLIVLVNEMHAAGRKDDENGVEGRQRERER